MGREADPRRPRDIHRSAPARRNLSRLVAVRNPILVKNRLRPL